MLAAASKHSLSPFCFQSVVCGLCGMYSYFPHFTNSHTAAQRSEVTCHVGSQGESQVWKSGQITSIVDWGSAVCSVPCAYSGVFIAMDVRTLNVPILQVRELRWGDLPKVTEQLSLWQGWGFRTGQYMSFANCVRSRNGGCHFYSVWLGHKLRPHRRPPEGGWGQLLKSLECKAKE